MATPENDASSASGIDVVDDPDARAGRLGRDVVRAHAGPRVPPVRMPGGLVDGEREQGVRTARRALGDDVRIEPGDPPRHDVAAVRVHRLVEAAPERERRRAVGGPHQLIADGAERARPGLEVQLRQHVDALADPAPVLDRPLEPDPRDAADALELVVVERRVGVHQHDASCQALDLGRGAEVALEEPGWAVSDPIRERVPERLDDLAPVGPGVRQLGDLERDPLSPVVSHQAASQRLRVQMHVAGDPVRDRQPDDVGGEHERAVLRERAVHGAEERVRRAVIHHRALGLAAEEKR